MNNVQVTKNRYGFGLGTIGRDAVYTMISMYQMFYLTDILEVSTNTMWILTVIIILIRIFDAVNDPFMGIIIDNTNSKYGKFKPWILGGAILSGLFTVLMFTDFNLGDTGFVLMFTLSYLLWEISFTANDIAFWAMLPALSKDQEERSKIGAVARMCANIGMFAMVVGIVPITNIINETFGVGMQKSYFLLAVGTVLVMWFFQGIMLLLVKEEHVALEKQEDTRFKDLIHIIFKNDQLLWIGISMSLFMIGYITTTSFGIYYFKYLYGNEEMYSIFALILGVSQLSALALSPLLTKWFNRKQMYQLSTVLVVVGYVIFFFAPTNTMTFIGLAGVLIFVGQAIIQLLMLMFVTDTVEYGEYKQGSRHESVTLSLQSFINKIGSALASGIVGVVLIISGMKNAVTGADMSNSGIMIFKVGMMILPLILIVIGYFIYNKYYIIDEAYFTYIVKEIDERSK